MTGGTGSFGKMFTEKVLTEYDVEKLIIFSRDEWKQQQLRGKFPEEEYPKIRYFIGNVRDKERLYRALDGVDIVIHAAALKQVPTAEYNPFEVVKTNVLGAQNVIDAAIDRGVEKVIALSTDKAASPINLYGSTKLCSDKLFVAANHYTGQNNPAKFSVVRYGNVLGSRGSVIPLFLEKKEEGVLPITDFRMTRFWITLQEAVDLVLFALEDMRGGETYVPKIPSMKIVDLAKAIAPEAELKEVGIRPGEKLHEVMIPRDVARNALEFEDHYVIQPTVKMWGDNSQRAEKGQPVEEGFEYSSDKNEVWLSTEELHEMINDHPHLEV